MSIYVLLYQFCQLFPSPLFPTLKSIFLFKRPGKIVPRKQTWTLTLTQHFHFLKFNTQLYMIRFLFALIFLAKVSLELASEKSVLLSILPTYLPSKAKNHNPMYKENTEWLRVACLLHLVALHILP